MKKEEESPIRQCHEQMLKLVAKSFYKELIKSNLAHMLSRAGGPARLRPHVKTHKTREIARMELEAGITKHKCATLAEAEMLA